MASNLLRRIELTGADIPRSSLHSLKRKSRGANARKATMDNYDIAVGPRMKSKTPSDLLRSRRIGLSREVCVKCGVTKTERFTTHKLDCDVPGIYARQRRSYFGEWEST